VKNKQKTILFHSGWSKLKTGFSINAKNVLTYLFKTGKYRIVEYGAGGITYNDERCKDMPWECYGTMPNDRNEIAHLQDPGQQRMVHYGSWNIDKVIAEVKPDVYIGAEDCWGFADYQNKPWWGKFPCAIWTTLDSLPILEQAYQQAEKTPNYWVWASFAEKAMRERAPHVKTLHGMFNLDSFKPMVDESKARLKAQFGLQDTTIFGFVFRNQLRKLVGAMLEGFADFKKSNPKVKAKLLLHTNFSEGWDIPRFMKEFNLAQDDVLTTYLCRKCRNVYIFPFVGNGVDCRICNEKGAAGNATIGDGVTEEQLNYIYNAMDAYIHPMTSGGLEMPIVEAMFCGLPVATVGYSCGTEFTNQKFVYPLQYSTYREFNSGFIKSSPHPLSIKAFMEKVVRNPKQYKEYGMQGAKWAREEFDPKKVGKFLEDFIDNSSCSYDFDFTNQRKDDTYPFKEIPDETEWLKDLYKNILKMDLDTHHKDIQHWLGRMRDGVSRQQVYEYFIMVARKENSENQKVDIKSLFKDTGRRKMVYVIPGSIGDCVVSLNVIKQLKEDYPEYDIYVCTQQQYNEVFLPFVGELIDGLIPYVGPIMDQFKFWEGGGDNSGLVDIAWLPFIQTQRISNYTHNGLDKNKLQDND
jgi:glycosyltransferase involved in cell wall biosynthesis